MSRFQSLDETIIEDLKSLDAPDEAPMIEQLGQMYLSNFKQLFVQIEELYKHSKDLEYKRLAHQLVSSSGNMGAFKLSNYFRELESSNVSGERVSQLLQLIKIEFEQVEQEILSEIRRQKTV